MGLFPSVLAKDIDKVAENLTLYILPVSSYYIPGTPAHAQLDTFCVGKQ